MWLFRTSGDSKTPMAIYEYQPDRKHCRPAEFLGNWSGFLLCDGYEAYHKLPGVTPVGCLAHVRRKFYEAKMALLPDKGLKYCDKLIKLEKKFAYYSPENNFKARFEGQQKESKPLFDEFFAWAESLNALPQSAIGKTVNESTKRIFANPREPFDVTPFVDKKRKTPIEDIQAAVYGYICPE
jgi:transposase